MGLTSSSPKLDFPVQQSASLITTPAPPKAVQQKLEIEPYTKKRVPIKRVHVPVEPQKPRKRYTYTYIYVYIYI